ncbi:recombination enhancement function domain protein [Escherichia coli]|nr:recombination enhancement function domain protein [Escherichia coli]MBE9701864.1 recombination enhancement function domain protein [Escherichia coli]HAZ7518185.1 recombination enhancement function domain protein [Escherichia coli]
MDALAKLPCTACWLHKHHQLIVSLHHVNGRTAAGAHMDVLPLCRWHHQDAAPKADREQYPWLVPVHASGNVSGKAEFTRLNASEEDLLLMAYKQAGITREGR